MTASQIIFYILAALILIAGWLSVHSRRIFRSAIWLLLSLIGVGGLYFWMDVGFIAAVQVIVYVGGIVVLIIFSIFLTQQSGKEMPKPVVRRQLFSILAVLLGFAFTASVLYHHPFPNRSVVAFHAEPADIGTQLLSTNRYGYVLPFEVVSMLLLAAMIGCIVIAMKEPQAAVKGVDIG